MKIIKEKTIWNFLYDVGDFIARIGTDIIKKVEKELDKHEI